jgi:hypothetical protein
MALSRVIDTKAAHPSVRATNTAVFLTTTREILTNLVIKKEVCQAVRLELKSPYTSRLA